MSSRYGYSRDPKLDIAPEGWFSDEEGPSTKKQKLETRFKTATEQELDNYAEKQPPKNTVYSTAWVYATIWTG